MTNADCHTTDSDSDSNGDTHYANGRAYATRMAHAAAAAHSGDHRTAQHHARVADRILWPLAEIDNAESLRDFIAGTNSGFETHLRELGTILAP